MAKGPARPVKKENPEMTSISEHTQNAQEDIPASKIFFHPDCTVGFGVAPNHALRLVGFTTGGESHPALKIS